MDDKVTSWSLDDMHFARVVLAPPGYEWDVFRLPLILGSGAGNAAPILSSDKPEPTADAARNAAEAAFRELQELK